MQAAERTSPAPTASMDQLQDLVAADMARVNDLILARVSDSPVPLITELASYIIHSGGKRLRPAMVIACAQLCGYKGDRHHTLAACVEFIHTATLLHDDVVDESTLRRGQPTANDVWNNQSSVLVGDFLFSRAFQLMVSDGAIPVLKLLSDTAATISEGEVKQLTTMYAPETSTETYLEVIRCKTAALFAAAAQIGAMVSNRPADEKTLYQFGEAFGIAFQLVDDALDYRADEAELGKRIGDDFREGKITLPVILAWQGATDSEQQFLSKCLSESYETTEAELQEVIAILNQYRTIEQTLGLATSYAESAQQLLEHFPMSNARAALEEALQFCVSRAY
ncbi:MAG: farnesyltranstransferase [Rickettsiales bacterium]|nr:farnesyltranstransferase [Rickettsiales bacterium]